MKLLEAHAELRSCLSDWTGLLANNNFIERNRLICWPNYEPSIFDKVLWEDVEGLASKRQYSFQFRDGSIVQMLYDFQSRDGSLRCATLGYYEARPEQSEDEADESEAQMWPDQEDLPDSDSPRWIRLDYEATDNHNCIHSECHLHLSGFPTTRIIVNGVPGPRQFLEMLVAWFYPDIYSETHLAKSLEERRSRSIHVNRLNKPLAALEGYHPIMFLCLPASIRQDALPTRAGTARSRAK